MMTFNENILFCHVTLFLQHSKIDVYDRKVKKIS